MLPGAGESNTHANRGAPMQSATYATLTEDRGQGAVIACGHATKEGGRHRVR
jgi:hypothetical protein